MGHGQPDAYGDDLLDDLVEGVLTLCSSTGSDLKLHLIDGVRVLMVSSSLRLWTERRGNSLTSIGRPLFLPLFPAFLLGRCFDLKFVSERLGGGGGPPTHHPPQGRILTSCCPFLLQGADNEGGFGLISAFFVLQGAED